MQSITVNFIHLTQFSQEQWNDVLNYGGCDIYAANGSLKLPEDWKKTEEKIPIQAKILWWLAWLGVDHLDNVTLNSGCSKIFDSLEMKFDESLIRFIFSILIASREGLTEPEVVSLIQKTVDDEGKFCFFFFDISKLCDNNISFSLFFRSSL